MIRPVLIIAALMLPGAAWAQQKIDWYDCFAYDKPISYKECVEKNREWASKATEPPPSLDAAMAACERHSFKYQCAETKELQWCTAFEAGFADPCAEVQRRHDSEQSERDLYLVKRALGRE